MSTVGFATLQIIPSAQGFASALNGQTVSAMSSAGKAGGESGGKAMGGGLLAGVKGMVGPIAAVFAGMKAIDFLGDSMAEFREAEKVSRVLAQEITTTGAAAWTSAGKIGDFSTALQNKIAVDDDAIKANETLLLSFRNVTNQAGAGNDIFNQTTTAAYDMAQVMGGDAQSSVMMLGKALNDPIAGMSKLTRAGVTFTDAQKEQVKALVESGNVLGAQKVILAEVQHEFGGAAAAAVDPAEKLSVAWGNLKESVGGALVPAMNTAIGVITPLVSTLTEKLAPAGATVGKVLGTVGEAFGALFQDDGAQGFAELMDNALGNTGKFVGPLRDVANGILSLKDSAVSGFQAFASAFGPIGPILDDFKAAFTDRMSVVMDIVRDLAPAFSGLQEKATPVFAKIGEAVRAGVDAIVPVFNFLTDVIRVVWDLLGPTIVDIVKVTFDTLWKVIGAAFDIIKGIFEIIKGLFTGDWALLWKGVKDVFGGAWDAIVAVVGGALKLIWDLLVRIFGGAVNWLKDEWNKAWKAITDAFGTTKATLGRLVDDVVGFFTGIPGRLGDLGVKVGNALVNGIKAIWNNTIGGLGFDGLDVGPVHIPGFHIPKMAKGGVVNKATLALIGEAGPEAVIPLSKSKRPQWLDGLGGGGDRVLNYYAAPGNSLPAEEDLFAAAGRARMVW